jgi:DNA-binding response OmpR family regulator
MKILLADDDDVARKMIAVALDRETATIALARLEGSLLARQITAERDQRPPTSIRRHVSQSSLARVRA